MVIKYSKSFTGKNSSRAFVFYIFEKRTGRNFCFTVYNKEYSKNI